MPENTSTNKKKMYAIVIRPNIASTLLAKCLPQELNLYEDTEKIDGNALVKDNKNVVELYQSRGINVIDLHASMQDALIKYIQKDPLYTTLFEERGPREAGPSFKDTIARTPHSLEELMGDMRQWASEALSIFNDSLEHSRNGVKLTTEEWSLIEQQILKDRDEIMIRNNCSPKDAIHYALAWNNLLFRGEGPIGMEKIMQAYGAGRKDHVAGTTVVTRDGSIMKADGTRYSATMTLPVGSNIFFATDTHEVFSVEGENDYSVLLGNMQKLVRQAEPNLVRAGLINLGLDPAKIVQPEHIWEGGNLIKFFGNCQSDNSHKAIYIGITERTGYRAAQDMAMALHGFISKNNVKVYVVDLPQGGNTTTEAQENMHLDFKMNWFVEEDGKCAVVLNAPALQKSAGQEKKFYRVRELVYRTDQHDLQRASTYLPSQTSEEIVDHFKRLQKEKIVSDIHMLKHGEHEFGANFVDGVTTGDVFIAPETYPNLTSFVKSRGRNPILLSLVNNAAFGSIRCSTTSFYAAGDLLTILQNDNAVRYIRKAA